MINTKQHGFTIVEALIAVAAIAIIVISGYVIYQHTKQSATTTGAASNPSQSPQTTTQPGPTVAYLAIKEWGIQLPLSASIKDAIYIPSATIVDGSGNPAAMWLSTSSIVAAGCALSNARKDGGGAIGELMRIAPGQTNGVTGELLTKEFPNGTTINGYYYAYNSWVTSNTCASTADLQTPDTAFTAEANGHLQAATTSPTN